MMRPIEVGPENQLIKNKILKTNELSNQYIPVCTFLLLLANSLSP